MNRAHLEALIEAHDLALSDAIAAHDRSQNALSLEKAALRQSLATTIAVLTGGATTSIVQRILSIVDAGREVSPCTCGHPYEAHACTAHVPGREVCPCEGYAPVRKTYPSPTPSNAVGNAGKPPLSE